MKNLSDIVLKYPLTDKGPIKNDGTKGHNYTKTYEKYFNNMIDKKLNILEIGFGGGDSLKLWAEFFPHSNIFCIDNNLSRLKEYGYIPHDRINIFYADQSISQSILDSINEMSITEFDIIIDDGSHIDSHIRVSFETLFPLLKKQGLYFVEDAPYKIEFENSHIESIDFSKSEYSECHLITIKKK